MTHNKLDKKLILKDTKLAAYFHYVTTLHVQNSFSALLSLMSSYVQSKRGNCTLSGDVNKIISKVFKCSILSVEGILPYAGDRHSFTLIPGSLLKP